MGVSKVGEEGRDRPRTGGGLWFWAKEVLVGSGGLGVSRNFPGKSSPSSPSPPFFFLSTPSSNSFAPQNPSSNSLDQDFSPFLPFYPLFSPIFLFLPFTPPS